MDAELENTRPFNAATTPLIVRQLLKNWASTMPQQWQVESRSGLEPHAIIQMIRERIETKHKDIKDATERKETIKQEYEDSLEDYECIVFGQ
jgi:hypothetical protein